MIKQIVTASCMTLLLASCDILNPEEPASNTAPEANYTASINGNSVSGDINIEGPFTLELDATSSSDDSGIKSIEWEVDGVVVSNTLIYNHSFSDVGLHTVTLTVTDTNDVESIETFRVTVSASSVNPNQPPVVTVDSNITVNAGSAFNLEASVFDNEGDVLTSYWTINNQRYNGQDVLVSKIDNPGTYIATFTVSDGINADVTKSTNVTVVQGTVENQAPVLHSVTSDFTVETGTAFNLSGQAFDDDNDPLTLRWTLNNTIYNGGAVQIPASNNLSVGVHTATFTASDGQNNPVTKTVDITVVAPNQSPVIQSVGSNILVGVGEDFILNGRAVDADGDVLSAFWVIEDQTLFGNTVSVDGITVAGIYTATYTVTDNVNDPVSQTVIVTVVQGDVPNQPPVVNAGNNITVNSGSSFILNGTANDVDGDNLTATWAINNNSYTGLSRTLTLSAAGQYTAVLSVSDGVNTVTDSIVVTVLDVVSTGDESYSSGVSTMPAQYSLSTIENCGVNTALPNNEFLIIGGVVIDSAFGWNHIDSTSGDWAGLTKQPSDYDYGQTGYNATDANCNNKDTYNAVLVKKLHDWNEAHSNGFKYSIDSSNPTFEEMDVITLDIYFDANDSSIPTKADITSAYSSHLSAAQITALDGNGDFQLDIQLNVDLPNPSNPPTLYYDTEGDIHGTINLNLTAAQANKWLRLEIPVDSLIFREETANWGVTEVNYDDVKHLSPGDVSFVAETLSRNTVRHLLDDSVKNDDVAFANENITQLFKEQSFRIKQLSISKTDTDGTPINTAPIVDLGANQTVSINTNTTFSATVSDAQNDTLSYAWFVDNGLVGTNPALIYSFSTAKDYSLRLDVSDGLETTSSSIVVTAEAAVNPNACPGGDTPVGTHGQLSITYGDSKVRDCNGEITTLRGMSMFWSEWSGNLYNSQLVDWLVDDWNISLIRAAMGVDESCSGDSPLSYVCGYANDQTAKVETIVDAAIANDIYVIIDWHSHHAEDYTSEAVAFFRDMAIKYGDKPNVIYEIYNEPLAHCENTYQQSGNCYADGVNTYWSDVIKPYAETVIAEIRKYDPDNLIIVGTRTWSQRVDEAADDPIEQDNIGYTVHFYAGTHGQSVRDFVSYAMNKGMAIFSTEWGTSDASGGADDPTLYTSETNTWLQFFEDNDISWANWSIITKDETSAALKSGASEYGGWDANNVNDVSDSGRLVRSWLLKY